VQNQGWRSSSNGSWSNNFHLEISYIFFPKCLLRNGKYYWPSIKIFPNGQDYFSLAWLLRRVIYLTADSSFWWKFLVNDSFLLNGFRSKKLSTRKFMTTWKLLHIKAMIPLYFKFVGTDKWVGLRSLVYSLVNRRIYCIFIGLVYL
jgi:hypothetical protein